MDRTSANLSFLLLPNDFLSLLSQSPLWGWLMSFGAFWVSCSVRRELGAVAGLISGDWLASVSMD